MVIGSTISHYEIVEKLGEGGMGVVYKAEDTQLRRTVALKFISRETLDEGDVKARLIREAQAAAGLDHPNICQVFGIHEEDGETFIAMAYIDGPSLEKKVKERPLPLDDALSIASQIAEALQEAHEQGVVHRDIKPQNILLTAKGQVKVLDFGLATLMGRSKLTKTGTTLGTPAYMSPEQLEGKDVDRRADVWALGCVLYEMLTQRTPFDAEYEQAIGYGILNEEPEPVSAQRADISPETDRLIRKALAKNPAERYQHADDLLADLRVLQKEQKLKPASGRSQAIESTAIASAQHERSRMARLPQLVAAACALAALAMGILYFNQTPARLPALKTSILPPENTSFYKLLSPAALSPDGRRIAFFAADGNQPRLWIRDLDSLEARAVPDSEGALFPFWSPDSQSVGFFAGSELKRAEAAGGPPQTIAAGVVVSANGRGASWSTQDVILFSGFAAAALSTVPAAGGSVEQATSLDESAAETSHRWPFFLPDGRHYLYTVLDADRGESGVYWAEIGTDQRRRVASAVSNAAYASGYLFFVAEQTLMAQPFSPGTGETTGEASPVAEGVLFNPINLLGFFSVSHEGLILYTAGGPDPPLTWYDRDGNAVGTLGPPSGVHSVSISTDGTQVAASRSDGQQEDLWLHQLSQDTESRFTFDYGFDILPIWSPDGENIVFSSNRSGRYGLYQRAASGSGPVRELLPSGDSQLATDWSNDGRYLVFMRSNEVQKYDLWVLSMAGETDAAEDAEPVPFLQTLANEAWAKFSPDGNWLAYVSDETGRNEVFVQSFPVAGSKFQISEGGGGAPAWRRDGKELFYVSAQGEMIAASVETGTGRFAAGARQALFEASLDGTQIYDVTADGRRFLLPSLPGSGGASTLTLVVNGLP